MSGFRFQNVLMLLAIGTFSLSLALVGCKKESQPATSTPAASTEQAEQTGDQMKEQGEKAMEEGKEAAKEGADKAKDAAKDAADSMPE